jgi:hypothetical protein
MSKCSLILCQARPANMELKTQRRNELAEPIIRHRTRIRPVIQNPTVPPSVVPPVRIDQDRTRVFSEGPTIRCLRAALGETPIKLRELEAGWRERRRILSGSGGAKESSNARVPRHVSQVLPSKTSGILNYGKKGLSGHTPQARAMPALGLDQPPIISPPTPPPTPPLITQRDKPSRSVPPSTRSKDHTYSLSHQQRPSPILSSPLPPTHQPVRLTSRSADTIHIHIPTGSNAITLSLRAKSLIIRISHDGNTFDLLPYRQAGAAPSVAPRRLTLSEWRKWSDSDRREWDLVGGSVESYKRHTPRVSTVNFVVGCSN